MERKKGWWGGAGQRKTEEKGAGNKNGGKWSEWDCWLHTGIISGVPGKVNNLGKFGF